MLLLFTLAIFKMEYPHLIQLNQDWYIKQHTGQEIGTLFIAPSKSCENLSNACHDNTYYEQQAADTKTANMAEISSAHGQCKNSRGSKTCIFSFTYQSQHYKQEFKTGSSIDNPAQITILVSQNTPLYFSNSFAQQTLTRRSIAMFISIAFAIFLPLGSIIFFFLSRKFYTALRLFNHADNQPWKIVATQNWSKGGRTGETYNIYYPENTITKASYTISIGNSRFKPWIFKKEDKNLSPITKKYLQRSNPELLIKEYLVVAMIDNSNFMLPLDKDFTYIKKLNKKEKIALREHINQLITQEILKAY